MKSMIFKNVLIIVALSLLAGCDGPINQKAIDLATDLSVFRDNQSKKLDQINARFDQSYKNSITMLEDATNQELRLDRDRDAQQIADQIVKDRNNSLRSVFRDNLAQVVVTERQRIVQADQSIEDAREKYSAAYQKASLALGKLDNVISDLNVLGQTKSDLSKFYDFAQSLTQVYHGLQAQEPNPAPATSPASTSTSAGPVAAAPLTKINRRFLKEKKNAK